MRFVRAKDLAGLRHGSLEEARDRLRERAIRVLEAVAAFEAVSTDPLPKPTAVVATFGDRAVVADATGAIHGYAMLGEEVVSRGCMHVRTLAESELRDERGPALARVSEAVARGAPIAPGDMALLLR